MSNPKCGSCNKTVYPTEKVDAVGKAWHKACFKCQDDTCHITLNLNNFKGHEGKVYCAQHVPKPKATAVADSVATKTALAAPKKTAEGLGLAQKGTGEKPTVGLDSVSTQSALNAPKKTAEGLGNAQKGAGTGAAKLTASHGEHGEHHEEHSEEHHEEQEQAYDDE
eukprot:TRINITY_DN5065_c0_g1_i1.p1 TRINITY_DN5065_c0_g1~~TRINITY_DN5065_c0_g1_i1.p1  ORF type:complete len:166 (+),score=50.43 TRINITY_DN5065_c0_g1_i1:78-575(+)